MQKLPKSILLHFEGNPEACRIKAVVEIDSASIEIDLGEIVELETVGEWAAEYGPSSRNFGESDWASGFYIALGHLLDNALASALEDEDDEDLDEDPDDEEDAEDDDIDEDPEDDEDENAEGRRWHVIAQSDSYITRAMEIQKEVLDGSLTPGSTGKVKHTAGCLVLTEVIGIEPGDDSSSTVFIPNVTLEDLRYDPEA